MKKNPKNVPGFSVSNEILELEQFHKTQATQVIAKLTPMNKENCFIQLDCIPNGSLHPFHYSNGINSAEIIRDIAGSYLVNECSWLDEKINSARNSQFGTDFTLGEKAGLWQRVSASDYQEKLDWTKPFCVKNEYGFTKIWHPNWRELSKELPRRGQINYIYETDFSTRSSIVDFIYNGPAYWQKFYLPLHSPVGDQNWRTLYRLVFLVEAEGVLDFIGGLWISRARFKIFPAKDSLVGLVSPLSTAYMFE